MLTRPALFSVLLSVTALAPTRAHAEPPAPSRVRVWKGDTAHTSEATVTLGAPPSDVYAAGTDFARWDRVLTDVSKVKVKSGDREHARVRFSSHALEHRVTVQFDNVKDRVVRFELVDGPPGARARGEYVVTPTPDGKGSVVRARLYLHVKGPGGWVLTDDSIRNMREKKLRADLEDLAKRFP